MQISFFEFVWGMVAMCGYIPVIAPILIGAGMVYNKLIDKLVEEDETAETAEIEKEVA